MKILNDRKLIKLFDMAKTTVTSKQFTLNARDFAKGLLVAVITPVFTILITSLNAGSLIFDWKLIGITAAGAALAYITKNLLSPGTVIVENEQVANKVKEGDAQIKIVEK